jgi:hypothetical protein
MRLRPKPSNMGFQQRSLSRNAVFVSSIFSKLTPAPGSASTLVVIFNPSVVANLEMNVIQFLAGTLPDHMVAAFNSEALSDIKEQPTPALLKQYLVAADAVHAVERGWGWSCLDSWGWRRISQRVPIWSCNGATRPLPATH